MLIFKIFIKKKINSKLAKEYRWRIHYVRDVLYINQINIKSFDIMPKIIILKSCY